MTDSILRFARRGLCAILIACMPLAAFAALSADDLAPLAADDFDAKSAAIDKLIANADAPSVAVLNALSDSSLVATDAGKVLIQTDDGNKDPLTNKIVRSARCATGHAEQSAALESIGRVVGLATGIAGYCKAPRGHRRIAEERRSVDQTSRR